MKNQTERNMNYERGGGGVWEGSEEFTFALCKEKYIAAK